MFGKECAHNFGGRLTLAEAQVLPISKCLADLPTSTRTEMRKLFESVQEIWNYIRGSVLRFECEAVEIPELSSEVCPAKTTCISMNVRR